MSYDFLNNWFSIVIALLVLLALVAGYRAGRLTYGPTARRLRRGARWLLLWIGLAVQPLLVTLLIIARMWVLGWVLVSNRVTVLGPVLVTSLVAVVLLAVPRLWRIAALRDPETADLSTIRSDAAAPLLVVPIQTLLLSGVVTVYFDIFSQPNALDGGAVLEFWLPFVVAAGLLWWRQRRLREIRRAPDATSPTPLRRLSRIAVIIAVLAAGTTGVGSYLSWTSRLPDRYGMAGMTDLDFGGGPDSVTPVRGMVSVNSLTGPLTGTPDDTFTLTAAPKRIVLDSGRVIDGLAFNDQVPGPELRVHQGDLVQVTLVNHLPSDGVTLHWHGLDVPDAEDGVPGLTQNAVPPGHSFVYRFRVEQTGTFWYHTHEDAVTLLRKGLYGAVIVLPRNAPPSAARTVDITTIANMWQPGNLPALGTADRLLRRSIAPGANVRLRLINTDNNPVSNQRQLPRQFTLAGVPFRVAAIDGTDVNQPTALHDLRLQLAAGGRYDLTFTMPDHPVELVDFGNPAGGELFSPDGRGEVAAPPDDIPVFDPAHYGAPAPTPFTAGSRFDRRFTLILDDRLGFFDGGWHQLPTINGESFPHIPVLVVHEGDLVELTFINRSHNNHPMHLHGHHELVLSVDGHPVTGSPWWTDTLDIQPGQVITVAFRADNPGVWMLHCHNVDHAAEGMMTHLMYDNVMSPYLAGRATDNSPE